MDAGDDWRTQLQPAARCRIVNKIIQTMRRCVPTSLPEGPVPVELQRIAVRFEDKMYAAATSQSDYLRKISIKMLSIESRANTLQIAGPGSSSKGKKQKKLRCHFCKKGGHFKKDCLKRKIWFDKKASADSTAQTGLPGTADWQEELYQMIKSLKYQYFVELNDLYNKISIKIQHIDNHMPAQKSAEPELYEKMKDFKLMCERTLHFLQVNKSSIQPAFREKIPVYERQILSILISQRRKPVQAPGLQTSQQSGGQSS